MAWTSAGSFTLGAQAAANATVSARSAMGSFFIESTFPVREARLNGAHAPLRVRG